MGCQHQLLVSGPGYAVMRCTCGTYYLHVGQETRFTLSASRFVALADELSRGAADPPPGGSYCLHIGEVHLCLEGQRLGRLAKDLAHAAAQPRPSRLLSPQRN